MSLQDKRDESDSDYDVQASVTVHAKSEQKRKSQANKDGFEIVPVSEPGIFQSTLHHYNCLAKVKLINGL